MYGTPATPRIGGARSTPLTAAGCGRSRAVRTGSPDRSALRPTARTCGPPTTKAA